MATGKHNKGMIILGIILIIGFAATLLGYSEQMGWWKYLFVLPVIYGSVSMIAETEDPVEPGTFIKYLAAGFGPTLFVLIYNALERGVIR